LLLYTGGMPSLTWRGAYARVLAAPSPAVPIYHWGDIDEGGFRIAAVRATAAQATGRRVQPWMMSPADLPAALAAQADAPMASSLDAMLRAAERCGWSALLDQLREQPIRLEQESLDPMLPVASA
jgi:hypothetical protein